MQRYNLAKLARQQHSRKRGTTATLPPISERLGSVLEYRKALRAMLNEIARQTREDIIPLYAADRAQEREERRRMSDAPGGWWFTRLASSLLGLTTAANEMVERVLRLEGERHTKEFAASVKRAIGIDIGVVIRNEDLEDVLQAASVRSVALIRNLAEETLNRVQQTVLQAASNGDSVATLRKSLVEQFGIVGRRADLIAQDQMSKHVSNMNRIRQQQAGVKTYRWLSSRDERVRPRHRRLDGKQYKWGEATGAEGGLPPGQPVACRCLARGVVEF